MTDFDAGLRTRLQRLEGAVPPPREPSVAAVPARRPSRRRRTLILVAAAVVLLAATSLVAVANPDPAVQWQYEADEMRARDDIGRAMGDACLSRDEATALVRARLDALGYSDWTIRSDDRIREARCISAGVSGETHEVLLLPGIGADVEAGIKDLSAELMRRCASRDEAVALLRSMLTERRWNDPRIEVVGHLNSIPTDQADAWIKHFEAGCTVFGGAQFDQAGAYTWYLSSK